MTPIGSLVDTPLWYALSFAALMMVTGQLPPLIQAIRHRRRKVVIALSAASMLLTGGVFIALADVSWLQFIEEHPPMVPLGLQRFLYDLPWLVYAAAEAVAAVALFLLINDDRRYRKAHLTTNAIREAVDLLPEGLCVSDEDGVPLIVNLKMAALCRELTGALLTDGRAFREHIEWTGEAQNGSYLVRTPKGAVWLVSEDSLAIGGRTCRRLTAVDVTDRYRATEELKKHNERLRDIQRRMKAVSALSADMFVAQEASTARAALHNQLGQVLLMGRHLLEHPESADAGMVLMTTRQMNAFLLGEAEEPLRMSADALQDALTVARGIDVTVDMRGEPPAPGPARDLLAQAVRECAANAVKHAEGDRLTVELTREGGALDVRITNNGRPPKGPVAESGGLLSLRRAAEEAGAAMTVQSEPAFALMLRFPPGA